MRHLALAAALFATGAQAQDRLQPYAERPLDFALRLGHHTTSLKYGGSTIETSFDRATLYWREQFGEQLQLGLIGGYTSLTQTNNPATAGRTLSGHHLGVSLDIQLLRIDRLELMAGGEWLYQKADDDHAGQRVEIVTHEPSVRLGAGYALNRALQAYGGFRYGEINGEQRQSGTVNETRKVISTRETGSFAGLEWRLPEDGYLRIVAESGSDRNIALHFGRRY